MRVLRQGRIAYMAVLVFIIILAIFVLVAIAMILSMNEHVMTENKGAIFELVDTIVRSLQPVTVVLYEGTSAAIDIFWKTIGNV
jgi:hypothetical protein